jgi:hypothetical protein
MEYGLSIWDMVYRTGYLPYRYGHPGHRYGIWINDIGDDSIDKVISHIDMGYLVILSARPYLLRVPSVQVGREHAQLVRPQARGLHSSTSQLNLSRL